MSCANIECISIGVIYSIPYDRENVRHVIVDSFFRTKQSPVGREKYNYACNLVNST